MDIGASALLILVIGAFTSALAKRLRLGYAELLVIFSIIIALTLHTLGVQARDLTGQVIISVILPPLVFQAALVMDHSIFRKVQRTVILLALVGVAIAAVVCSLLVVFFTPLTFIAALAFGVIISPTDAAAVVDTLKQVKAPKELATIIEGESLLNDATALALFSAVSTLTLSPILNIVEMGTDFIVGAVVGFTLALATNKLMEAIHDINAQVMVTVASVYGSYLLADALNASGIVAVAILGITVGRRHSKAENHPRESVLTSFWNVTAFIATTVAFVFIGLASEVPQLLRYMPLILLCFLAALAARYISIQAVLISASRMIGPISSSWRNTTTLAGIRGAVSVALALSLPEFPFKGTIVAITLGVVLLSLLLQTRILAYYVRRTL